MNNSKGSLPILTKEFCDFTTKNQKLGAKIEIVGKKIINVLSNGKVKDGIVVLTLELSEQLKTLGGLFSDVLLCQKRIIGVLEKLEIYGVFNENPKPFESVILEAIQDEDNVFSDDDDIERDCRFGLLCSLGSWSQQKGTSSPAAAFQSEQRIQGRLSNTRSTFPSPKSNSRPQKAELNASSSPGYLSQKALSRHMRSGSAGSGHHVRSGSAASGSVRSGYPTHQTSSHRVRSDSVGSESSLLDEIVSGWNSFRRRVSKTAFSGTTGAGVYEARKPRTASLDLKEQEKLRLSRRLKSLLISCYYGQENLSSRWWQFQDGLEFKNWNSGDKAAVAGHVALMAARSKLNEPLYFTDRAVHASLEAKQLEPAEWLCNGGFCDNTLLDYAVESGCDEIVFKVLEHNAKGTELALEMAAAKGRMDLLQYLLSNKEQFITIKKRETISLDGPVKNGHLEIAEYLFTSSEVNVEVQPPSPEAITQAAAGGHLEVIEWVHAVTKSKMNTAVHGFWTGIANSDAMNAAAANGHLKLLCWLHTYSHCKPCTPQAMDDAAAGGHLNVVKWLSNNRTEGCSGHAMDSAAENGHLDVVEFLHFNRHEGCSNYAFDWSAKFGHLDVLKFLHNNRTEGCTERAMDWAAREGHLHVVKWLHVNRFEGCTKNILDGPASRGYLEVCEWLDKNRVEAGLTQWTLDRAAEYGHADVVEWISRIETAMCSKQAMDRAATNGHLDVVEWLHKNRIEGCTTKALDGACANGHVDVVEWLLKHRKEGFTEQAASKAAKNGYFNIVRLLEAKPRQTSIAGNKVNI